MKRRFLRGRMMRWWAAIIDSAGRTVNVTTSVGFREDDTVMGSTSLWPSRVSLRGMSSVAGGEGPYLSRTVMAPFIPNSSTIAALVFSVTRFSPLSVVLHPPCVLSIPPSRTLTPPSTVCP